MIPDKSLSILEILGQVSGSLGLVLPELILVIGLVLLLLSGIVFKSNTSIAYIGSLSIYSLALFLDYQQWIFFEDFKPVSLFFGLIELDRLGIYFKFLFETAGILTLLLTWFYKSKLDESKQTEYLVIIISIVLGAHFMVMSQSLL